MDIALVNLNIYYVRYIDNLVIRQARFVPGYLYLHALEQALISAITR